MDQVIVEARDDGAIEVRSGIRDNDNVQKIPGRRWVQAERVWTVPQSWAALQQLRGVFGDRLDVGPRLADRAMQVYEHRVKPCMELRAAQDAPDWALSACTGANGAALAPLQRAAVAFLALAGCAVEGDPQGSGKTPVDICAMKLLEDPFPMLIVCPNGVKPHWRSEFATWWPGVDVSVVAGSAKKRRDALAADAHVFAINWESLAKHSRVAGYGSIRLSDADKAPKELNEMGFRTVISDEAHRGKDPSAKQTRALWAVGDPAQYRFALTGTLIANSPEDLWPVMRFVSPLEYPSKGPFIERYGLSAFNAFGFMRVIGLNGDTKDELFRFLDPRLIRRPKEVILPQLRGKMPPVRRVVDLAPKQKKAYNKLRDEMIVELEGGVLMASNPLQRIGRLRQLAGATGTIDEDGNVQLSEPSTKVDELLQVIEDLGGDKAIVFAESRQLTEIAAGRLIRNGYEVRQYTGAVDPDERENNRLAFQDGHVQILLGTFGAMAEGVNLSAATATIYLERSWSAIKNSQSEERGIRMGPGSEGALPMRVVDIVAADTVDDEVLLTYGDKLEMLEEVVRDRETIAKWLGRKPV